MQSDQEEHKSADNVGEVTELSGDEFCQLQKQLIDLKNTNFELMERNRQLQMQQQKSNGSFRFASKLIGRKNDKQNMTGKWEDEINSLRTKLTTQEEEFRLQQSTLLAELNKASKDD
uniref:Cnn_1N domain-containing protein n=1 Tax=Syphacia muris TaxID=451379 RepID=A0A0N5ARU7_9BILA